MSIYSGPEITDSGLVLCLDAGNADSYAIPANGFWSNQFNGSSHLSVPYSSNFEFGNGDFTVEFWLYSAGVNTQGVMAFPHNASNYAQVLIFGGSASSLGLFSSSNGTSWDVSSGVSIGTINLNAWNHVAVSKSGSSIRLFMNGILQNTVTFAGTFTGTYDRCLIGDTTGNSNYNGFLSNVRVVKGTAVYTANFVPPTQPLTAIAGTSLLTCQSSTFIDNSGNGFPLTSTGTPFVRTFNPFSADTTTWSDISGQGNNGTLVGALTFDSANGGSLIFTNTGA